MEKPTKQRQGDAPATTKPSQVVLYEAADGKVTVSVMFARETFWLTQKTMAELFGVGIPAVNKHLKNICASGELSPEATISKMEMVREEGERQVERSVEFYNLDATIAVGYRVNSGGLQCQPSINELAPPSPLPHSQPPPRSFRVGYGHTF